MNLIEFYIISIWLSFSIVFLLRSTGLPTIIHYPSSSIPVCSILFYSFLLSIYLHNSFPLLSIPLFPFYTSLSLSIPFHSTHPRQTSCYVLRRERSVGRCARPGHENQTQVSAHRTAPLSVFPILFISIIGFKNAMKRMHFCMKRKLYSSVVADLLYALVNQFVYWIFTNKVELPHYWKGAAERFRHCIWGTSREYDAILNLLSFFVWDY